MIPARKIIPYVIVFLIGFLSTYLLLTLFWPNSGETGPASLKIEGLWDKKVFNAIKTDFAKDHPQVTLTYEQKSLENYYSDIRAELDQGASPDVFWWHSSWGPLLAANLASLPSSVFSSSQFEKTFYPITKTDLKIAGSYRGVPLEIDGLALLYNKDTLTAKNFGGPPRTWTSLRADYVPSLTALDGQRLVSSAIALGADNNVSNVGEIAGLFMLQNGFSFTKSGSLNLADPSQVKLAADALSFYLNFSLTDHTWDNTQPGSIEAFARGKTAMIILPAYKIHDLLAFLKQNSLTLNFGVEAVPQLPSAPVITWGSYWSLGVNEASTQKKAAWEFAKFVDEPATLEKIYSLESAADNLGRAYPRVDMASKQEGNIYLAAYLAQAKKAKSWYLNSDTFDKSLNDGNVAALKKALIQIEKGNSAEGALKNFANDINPTLKKYGIVSQ